jgi:GNAT superfamily N-acetyltransferase
LAAIAWERPERTDAAPRRGLGAVSPEFEISTDVARLDIDLIHGFLSTSYWARGRRRTVIERAIHNSLCFGVYLDRRQVAFARVVTDRAVFAYLMDVFVLPEYRGRGISKTLLRTILDHPDLQNLRVFLLVTRDAHGLYEKFGFRPLAQPDHVMELRDPDSDSRAQ